MYFYFGAILIPNKYAIQSINFLTVFPFQFREIKTCDYNLILPSRYLHIFDIIGIQRNLNYPFFVRLEGNALGKEKRLARPTNLCCDGQCLMQNKNKKESNRSRLPRPVGQL